MWDKQEKKKKKKNTGSCVIANEWEIRKDFYRGFETKICKERNVEKANFKQFYEKIDSTLTYVVNFCDGNKGAYAEYFASKNPCKTHFEKQI
jgi:hypothetical protein